MSETTQREKLLHHTAQNPLVRARDLLALGISGTTISRAMQCGELIRVARGLYQLAGAEMDMNTSLSEVGKQAPKAVICLLSALAFHGLTDQLPRKVWLAISAKGWKPKLKSPGIRVVRFREPYFSTEIKEHEINGVPVRIYSASKSIADAFRNPKLVARPVAVESLRTALEEHRASPSELIDAARAGGVSQHMRPYLEALTCNG